MEFRKNDGGVLITVQYDLGIQSRMMKIKYRAYTLSVVLKCSDGRHVCISTFYRVGTLEDKTHEEVNRYLNNISSTENINTLVGDMNLNNSITTRRLENKFH